MYIHMFEWKYTGGCTYELKWRIIPSGSHILDIVANSEHCWLATWIYQ